MEQAEKILINKIKQNYEPKEKHLTKLDELKALDKKVKMPAKIFAYAFGIVATLILGTGMCLAMEVIGSLMPLGIVVGLIGITMTILTYPIYKTILNKRKAKYGNEIIHKSNKLLNNENN